MRSDARKRLANLEHAGCEDTCGPGCRHYEEPAAATPSDVEAKCEGLAPFHCGNPDCPAHGQDDESGEQP